MKKLVCDYRKFSMPKPCGDPVAHFYFLSKNNIQQFYVRCSLHPISDWKEDEVDEATFLVAKVMES